MAELGRKVGEAREALQPVAWSPGASSNGAELPPIPGEHYLVITNSEGQDLKSLIQFFKRELKAIQFFSTRLEKHRIGFLIQIDAQECFDSGLISAVCLIMLYKRCVWLI